MATKPNKKPAGSADKGLRIVARPQAGFRRIGRHFGPDGETIPLSELTAEEVETVKAEAQLVVVEVDIPAA